MKAQLLKKLSNTMPLCIIPALMLLAMPLSYAQKVDPTLGSDSTQITPRATLSATRPASASVSSQKFDSRDPTLSPSSPKTNVYQCSSYRGQYDIDNNAVGTFTITTENNYRRPNYGQIIATNTAGCYQPCTPTDASSSEDCTVTKGADWLGVVNYNTHFSCSAGGYLQAGPRTYISDNCTSAPPPPPPPATVIGCEDTYGTIRAVGYITNVCNIPNQQGESHPVNQTYICALSNPDYYYWKLKNVGKVTLEDVCP